MPLLPRSLAAAIVAVVSTAQLVPAQLRGGHTNHPQPDDWDTLSRSVAGVVAVWNPDAAEWYLDSLNGTARNEFQPDMPIDMFAGRPFRLTLQLDATASSARRNWKVREPLPGIVRQVFEGRTGEPLSGNTDNSGQVHFDLMAADTVPSDDSGYLVVGFTHNHEWYTQPVALKLYASEQAVIRQTGSTAPIDDTQLGFAGFFFILFCTLNVMIVLGMCGHAVYHRDTWQAPPEAGDTAATPVGGSAGGGGKSLRGAPSTQRGAGTEMSYT